MLSAAHRIQPVESSALEPVVYLCGETSGRTRIARTLYRSLGRSCFVEDLSTLASCGGLPILAVHNEGLTSEQRLRVVSTARSMVNGPLVVVLAKPLPRSELAAMFAEHALSNMLVLSPNGVDTSDLLVALHQLKGAPEPGLEPHLGRAITKQTCQVSSSCQREGAIAWVDGFARELGVPSRMRSLLRVITDEVVTNALYNAPVSADGSHRFADQPRTEPVALPDNLAIELSMASDGERIGLSSLDPFGSLEASRVQSVLARGLRCGSDQVAETSGGAGLGLYRILDSVTHMVVNLDPGRSTEIIGILDVRGSYRELAARGSSFNTFVTEAI